MGVIDITHDFIYTSLYCRFYRLLSENVIKKKGGGVTVVVFKISDHENVNFASFSIRRYNGVLWKTHFFGTSLLHKNLFSEKKNGSQFFLQKLTQDGSMI